MASGTRQLIRTLVLVCGVAWLSTTAPIHGVHDACAQDPASAGDVSSPSGPSEQAAAPTGPSGASGAEAEQPADVFDLRGKVVDPKGQPVKGARVYLIYGTSAHLPPPKVRATTGADGTFRFAAANSELDTSQASQPWLASVIVAVAEGYGVDVGPTFCFDASGTILEPLKSTPSYSMVLSVVREGTSMVIRERSFRIGSGVTEQVDASPLTPEQHNKAKRQFRETFGREPPIGKD